MIFEIKKGEITYQVDDLILFENQPKDFKAAYWENIYNGAAEFDNASVVVFETGRVIITEK